MFTFILALFKTSKLERKHFQVTYPTKDLYAKYILKNSPYVAVRKQ